MMKTAVNRDRYVRGQSPRVCFLHVPKCGGTTVSAAFAQFYPAHQQTHLNAIDSRAKAEEAGQPLMTYRRALVPGLLEGEGCRFVAGHFPFNEAAYRKHSPRWSFITILREPVARWLSEYFYNRYKTSKHYKTESDLETYVANANPSRTYRNMLSEIPRYRFWKSPVVSSAETLESLAVVGCLERLDDFRDEVEAVLGLRLQIGHELRNPLPIREQRRMVTPEIRQRVEELCLEDTEIYREALALVTRRSEERRQ